VLIEPVRRRDRDEARPSDESGRPATREDIRHNADDGPDAEQARPDDGGRPGDDAGPALAPEHESSREPSGETESSALAGELPVWML
jgi:hypothetical protein